MKQNNKTVIFRSNLAPMIVELLRKAIINGEFKPGDRLNETVLALKFGISKSPIREALRTLESENFVRIYDRRGAFVKELSAKEVDEIYMVMKLIETAAVELAAKNMNEERERELTSIMKQMGRFIQSTNIEKVKILVIRLHTIIAEASENRLLLRIHNSLKTQLERLRIKSGSYGAAEIADILNEHIAITEALLRRDGRQAALLMSNHFDNMRSRVLSVLEKDA